MEGRQRSPSYPSTPLDEAIDLVRKIHNVERTNIVDREVAVKAMGYSGISGRSATVLSNLIQFGLVEKAGKNEVRVTRRSIDILYPDTDDSKADALKAAAQAPELFKAIAERFTDGTPSATALQAYLMRQGFTHAAVPAATHAFLATFLFLENTIGSGSNLQPSADVVEPQQNQQVEKPSAMYTSPQHASSPQTTSGKLGPETEGPDVRFSQKTIWLAGSVRDQAEAEELITLINALKPSLPPATAPSVPPDSEDEVFT